MKCATYLLKCGYHIKAVEGDHISKHFQRGDFYERAMLNHILSTYNVKTVVDVGAHVGNHSIFFAGVMKAEQVFAFEPHIGSYWLLCQNVTSNNLSAIKPMYAAIGSTFGWVEVEDGPDGNTGMAKIVNSYPTTMKPKPMAIPMFSLDALSLGHVDLIKIDTEGYGYKVLRGAYSLLKSSHPTIFIECIDDAELQDIRRLLGGLGYTQKGVWNATPTYEFAI